MSDPLLSAIARLGRLAAADGWSGDLNPTQRAALDYLSRANRFSRAPSHVADYLAATRGTVSQTLKSLRDKGYVTEVRSETDRRSIRYDLTEKGQDALQAQGVMAQALERLGPQDQAIAEAVMGSILSEVIALSDDRSFGVCSTCRHHEVTSDGRRCALLDAILSPEESTQICHEHALAD